MKTSSATTACARKLPQHFNGCTCVAAPGDTAEAAGVSLNSSAGKTTAQVIDGADEVRFEGADAGRFEYIEIAYAYGGQLVARKVSDVNMVDGLAAHICAAKGWDPQSHKFDEAQDGARRWMAENKGSVELFMQFGYGSNFADDVEPDGDYLPVKNIEILSGNETMDEIHESRLLDDVEDGTFYANLVEVTAPRKRPAAGESWMDDSRQRRAAVERHLDSMIDA